MYCCSLRLEDCRPRCEYARYWNNGRSDSAGPGRYIDLLSAPEWVHAGTGVPKTPGMGPLFATATKAITPIIHKYPVIPLRPMDFGFSSQKSIFQHLPPRHPRLAGHLQSTSSSPYQKKHASRCSPDPPGYYEAFQPSPISHKPDSDQPSPPYTPPLPRLPLDQPTRPLRVKRVSPSKQRHECKSMFEGFNHPLPRLLHPHFDLLPLNISRRLRPTPPNSHPHRRSTTMTRSKMASIIRSSDFQVVRSSTR